jgi:aryl carrier-like protein
MLSVEIVVDEKNDSLLVQAAWTEKDMDSQTVHELLGSLEEICVEIGQKGQAGIHIKPAPRSRELDTPSGADSDSGLSGEDEDENNNQDLIDLLRGVVADFLEVGKESIHPTTSFFSLGLDSIRAVGLSRRLRKEDIQISAADIMSRSSASQLARRITRKSSPSPKQDATAAFDKALEIGKQHINVDNVKYTEEDSVELFPTTTLQAGMLSQASLQELNG